MREKVQTWRSVYNFPSFFSRNDVFHRAMKSAKRKGPQESFEPNLNGDIFQAIYSHSYLLKTLNESF